MKKAATINLHYILICTLFLFSCTQSPKPLDEKVNRIEKNSVRFTYKDDKIESQYLITGKGDTLHTVIYENGTIVSNEGEYIAVIFTMLPETKEIEFEVSSIKIDTLVKVFFIRTFNDETGRYEPLFSEQLDSTYAKITNKFDNDTNEILLGVIYGNKNGALFTKYLAPVQIDFNNKSINETGRLDSEIASNKPNSR